MLELEGYSCESNVPSRRTTVPLVAKGRSNQLAIASYPAQLDPISREFEHPVSGALGGPLELINDYLLSRNLPAAYDQVRRKLDP
jgi:hypothetical protein